MLRELRREIEEVPYPPEHLDDLGQLTPLTPLMVKSIERDGLPIESGTINLGKLDQRLDRAYFLFSWIAENNDVIENLNMVLNDMRALPSEHLLFRGSSKTRFYLLLRTYFHEFYRFREIHGQLVKAAADRGYIKREDVSTVRKAFHDAFVQTIEVRNNLVHGSPHWKGQEHFDLTLIVTMWERGYAYKDLETGKITEIREVLKAICEPTADILRDEGNRMSSLLQKLVRFYVDILAEA